MERTKFQPPELPKTLEAARKQGATAQIKHFKESVLPLYVIFFTYGNVKEEGADARFAPTVFYDWFLLTWPEPSAWLASRLAYSRTLAVMSMIGYVLG